MNFGKSKAFFLGFYNSKSIDSIEQIIKKEQPDVVHIHNLYPFISPSILNRIKNYGIPIVMTVHNYRLLCPNGLFFNKGEICEKCTGRGKEFNCIVNNCEHSIFKSTGYALRNFWARKQKFYLKNVDAFLTLSTNQNTKLVEHGLNKNKCYVIPNMYSGNLSNEVNYKNGYYIAYVGRISHEKGLDSLFKLAERLPHINFKIAGTKSKTFEISSNLKNVEYVGFLTKEELELFYFNSKFILFPSFWNETFGMSIIEAFAHKKPVIANNLGASSEIIENNKSGFIYKGLDDLLKKVVRLNNDDDLIKQMGQNGFLKVKKEYSPDSYYRKLLGVYMDIIGKRNCV